MKDGGPAFPRDGRDNPVIVGPQSGMSLRDYFAAAALQGVQYSWGCGDYAMAARIAYVLADAMLAERER